MINRQGEIQTDTKSSEKTNKIVTKVVHRRKMQSHEKNLSVKAAYLHKQIFLLLTVITTLTVLGRNRVFVHTQSIIEAET